MTGGKSPSEVAFHLLDELLFKKGERPRVFSVCFSSSGSGARVLAPPVSPGPVACVLPHRAWGCLSLVSQPLRGHCVLTITKCRFPVSTGLMDNILKMEFKLAKFSV